MTDAVARRIVHYSPYAQAGDCGATACHRWTRDMGEDRLTRQREKVTCKQCVVSMSYRYVAEQADLNNGTEP